MSGQISGERIGSLIERAKSDLRLRMMLYYCPDMAEVTEGMSPEEARAVRLGDLSQVDLPEDLLAAGRKLFVELPAAGKMPPAEGVYHLYDNPTMSEVCT